MKLRTIRNFLSLRGKRKGANAMNSFVEVFIGLIIIVVLVVLGATMSGVMFQNVSPTINAIGSAYNSSVNATNSNLTLQAVAIKGSIQTSIANTFSALQSSTNYIGILVLALIMLLIMSLIMMIRGGTQQPPATGGKQSML